MRGTGSRDTDNILVQDESDKQHALEEAMDWLLRLRDEPECPQTNLALKTWLMHSERNRAAWQSALKTWALMGEVEPGYKHLWQQQAASVVPLPRRRGRIAGAVFALAATITLVLAAPSLLVWWQADFRTGTGESRVVTLADGTQVNLSGGSAIDVDLTPEGRRVHLLVGQAFFDVTHDSSRPFTVDAGNAKVVVLGTAFDVALDDDATTVQLARGVVGISGDGANRAVSEMAPGDVALVDDMGTITRSTVPVNEIGTWRNGLLFVNDVTIDGVVSRLQRYHPAWISVPDRALGRKRVTGLYDLRDPDRALNALVQPYGGKVRGVSGYARIVSRF
jgi:transmembrane sensor